MAICIEFPIEFPDDGVRCSEPKYGNSVQVWGDGGDYRDERLPLGDRGVEAFLFGSVGFRTEGSGRTLTIDFLTAIQVEGGEEDFPGHLLMEEGFPTEINELNNNSLKLDNSIPQDWLGAATEQECHDQNGTGRGILCITPGASRASGFKIGCDDDPLVDPNRLFKIRIRDDQWVAEGADNVKITRCCNNDGFWCDTSGLDVPGECLMALPMDGENLEFTWVYPRK